VKIANTLPGIGLPIDTALFPAGLYAERATETPISTHFHGLEVGGESDGNPMAFYTKSGKNGSNYKPVLPCASS
jgi:hypothetical protein